MGFLDGIRDIRQFEWEAVHFEAYERGYYALLRRGDRLDIQRVFTIQPPIDDPDDYYAFMFAQTLQGFFVMRQRVIDGKTGNWEVFLEVIPEEPHRFFAAAQAHWCRIRDRMDGAPENREIG